MWGLMVRDARSALLTMREESWRKITHADQLRTTDGAEKSRPEIRLWRSRGDALRLRHRHGQRSHGREGTRLRQRDRRRSAAAEGGADLRVRRRLGRGSGRDEPQPRDGGRRRARHHLSQAVGDLGEHHRRLHGAGGLGQGQGQGRGDPPPDRAEGCRQWREACDAGGLALRARRWRLRRTVRRPARPASDAEPRAGSQPSTS